MEGKTATDHRGYNPIALVLLLALILCSRVASAGDALNSCGLDTGVLCYSSLYTDAGPTTTDNVTANKGNQVQVSAGSKDKNASINFTLAPGATTSVLNLSVSAPIDSSNQAQLATLDGLSNTYNATLNYKYFDAGNNQIVYEDCMALREALDERWKKDYPERIGKPDFAEFTNFPHGCELSHIQDLMAQFTASEKLNIVKTKAYRDMLADYWGGDRWTLFLGGALTYGANQYKYVDMTSATQMQQTKNSWSVGGYIGFFKIGDGVVDLSYTHQLTQKEGSTAAVCNPGTKTGPFRCVSGPVGAPTQQDKNILSIGYRNQYTHWAWSPSINYDYVAKTTGIDVPIYLVQDSQSNYTGGVRFGWHRDTHEFTAIVFAGSSFNYFDTSATSSSAQ